DVMLRHALTIEDGPVAIRYPKGPAPQAPPDQVGSGLDARRVRDGSDLCILAVGKMLEAAEEAARLLEQQGLDTTGWDVRVGKPLDADMLADAARHPVVVTVEDGVRQGGAGAAIADALRGLRGLGAGAGAVTPSPPVVVLGVPDEF